MVHGNFIYFFWIAPEKKKKLIGQTSVWMFPIYGMAAVIEPVYRHAKGIPLFSGGSSTPPESSPVNLSVEVC